jgi:multidrug efflux pump subunit AcrA (membrane-fusion protein)
VNPKLSESEPIPATETLQEKPQSTAKPRPPKGWLPWLGAGLLVLGGSWLFILRSSNPGANAPVGGPPPAPVKIATLETTTLEDSTNILGTLDARRTVVLKPEVDGRITRLSVQDGDRVQQGQVIATLDNADLRAERSQAQARLASAKAHLSELTAGSRREDIAEAQAKFNEAQSRLRNAQIGGQPQEIAQAQAQVIAAQAEARLANQRAQRYAQIREEGAISADQYQEYLTNKQRADAALNQAQRRLSQLSASRQSDIGELTAALEQARQNLKRLQNGARPEEIAQARADAAAAAATVNMVETRLDKTQIRAPISGVVGNIPLKLGDYLEKGDKLTTITENNALELNLSIPLEKAPQLRLGLPVEILDAQNKAIATGKISFISPNVTSDSQLLLAKASFSNAQIPLLNQQYIQARVIWDRRPGLLVPSTALNRVGGANFVFVAVPPPKSDKSPENAQPASQQAPQQAAPPAAKSSGQPAPPPLVAQQRSVVLGEMQGNQYQVISGLKPGEKIVTAGILQLREGAPIQVLPGQ